MKVARSKSTYFQNIILTKLSSKVQVLNTNLVATCMLYGDAYHTRLATRNAGASVQRAIVMRQSQMGSHTRPDVRNVQVVIVFSLQTARLVIKLAK
jgi:hypothetical protein